MNYQEVCNVYSELENTTKGLEKTTIIAKFLGKIKNPEVIYLLQGRVFPEYDNKEFGISEQLAIKAIAKATGSNEVDIIKQFKTLGDLGNAVEKLTEKRKQSSLFSKELTVEKVLSNLKKLPELIGKGSVDRKLSLIAELLNSASSLEAKFIIRTCMGDLKIGVGSSLLRDAIVEHCLKPKNLEEKKHGGEEVQAAYDKVLDFAEIFSKTCEGKLKSVSLSPGKPVKVMLYPKAESVEDAFKIVGKPAAFEYKYDGFRMMINKDDKGNVKIFTRRLENVSLQFPDAVKYVREYVNAKSFIIDCEAVGYDPKTKKYLQFQAISQRIKRKYDIEKLEKELPIELNIFDVIFYDGESLIDMPFQERRKILEKIVHPANYKIRLSEQIITGDEKEAGEFYLKALEEKQEGLMAKSLTAPYKPGARVGYAVKIKPEARDFDLVITGAEYGTGKRAGWLTSFDVSCLDSETDQLLEIGKVSTGLKEKEEEGLSFKELTTAIKKIITGEEGKHVFVKPEIVVTVGYQNIQESPTYTSGYALRFPTIKTMRPDRSRKDIATLKEIKKEARKG